MKGRRVDIEYVIATVSKEKSYGQYEDDARLAYSPRSSEAFLMTGVEPNELRVRELDSFWEPNIDAKVQRLRHEDYSLRRRDLIKEVRSARSQLIKREMTVSTKPTVGMDSNQDSVSTTVVQEEARLRKIQAKKQKEIEQMLTFEMKQVELQEQNAVKERNEEEKRKQIENQVQKQKIRSTEIQRMKQMQREAEMEVEERTRRALAEKEFLKQKALAAQAQMEEEIRRREAMQRQMERDQKQQALKEQTEKIMKQQHDAVQKRLKTASEKEALRQMKLEKQKAKRSKALEEKQKRAKERIEMNKKLMEEADRKREDDFRMKEEIASHRAQRIREQKEEEFRRKNIEAEALEAKRMQAIEDTRRDDEIRARDLMVRQAQVEEAINKLEMNKNRNLEIQKEQTRLRQESKLKNVLRQQRKEEYKRMQIVNKLEEQSDKIHEMLEQKANITQKRKEAALQAKIKRDNIADAMEKIKQHKKWAQADKLLQNTLSAPKLKSKKKGKPLEVYQSNLTAYEKQKAAEAVALRMQRKQEEQKNSNKNATQSAEYISPYEAEKNIHPEKTGKLKKPAMIPAFASVNDGEIYF